MLGAPPKLNPQSEVILYMMSGYPKLPGTRHLFVPWIQSKSIERPTESEVIVRIIHRRLWIGVIACGAIAITFLYWFYLSKSRPDAKTVSAAEDEVYEAVVATWLRQLMDKST
jgi:hypothetical protein